MSVYSVSVYPSSTTIKTGNWYYGAYAIVNASSNCNTDVRWYSNNTNVATVNASSGYIYAKAPGTARIYAQSTVDSSKKDYITVTVTSGTICVDSVTLNRSSISLEKGDTFTLSATVCPTNATNKSICWSSTNPSVATVSGGVVTAKASGYAYIYAEAQDGSGEYDSCYVNVTEDILVTSVTVSPSSKTMNIGASTYLYETVCPTNATNKCVKWSSNKTSVATVNPDTGLVIAQGAGTATITATAQDGSGKKGYCTITVNAPIRVTGVEVCPTSLTLNVGDIEYLCASITPYNATNQTVTWCSSNESVATVGLYTGKVTAKKAGTTTITATTADGGFQDCITITVKYCGGSNYRDVTKHNMILQSDGYYVCSKCGYRVKSPALQDKNVLNKSDYLTVVSLLHEYLSIIQQYPIYAEKMLAMIDAIRGLPENKTKYEYCDENGVYVPEFNKSFGNTQMYIHVDKGSCVTEWVLLKSMYSIISAIAPFPYSIMISAITDLVAQEHPGVSQMTGADIAKNFASYLADGFLSIPNSSLELFEKIKNAAEIYLTFATSSNEISCTDECYNINIVAINKEESCDCHQIKYHYSDGVETMGRYSEYNVDGINTVFPGADYYDHVNDREYDVYH